MIPLPARVAFMSSCSIFWNFYLSTAMNKWILLFIRLVLTQLNFQPINFCWLGLLCFLFSINLAHNICICYHFSFASFARWHGHFMHNCLPIWKFTLNNVTCCFIGYVWAPFIMLSTPNTKFMPWFYWLYSSNREECEGDSFDRHNSTM